MTVTHGCPIFGPNVSGPVCCNSDKAARKSTNGAVGVNREKLESPRMTKYQYTFNHP